MKLDRRKSWRRRRCFERVDYYLQFVALLLSAFIKLNDAAIINEGLNGAIIVMKFPSCLSSSLALRLSLNKLVNSRILYNYDCRSMLSAVVRIRIDSLMKWSGCSQKSGFIRQHNTLDNTKANTGSLILYRLVWSSIGRGEGEDIVVIEIIDQFGA